MLHPIFGLDFGIFPIYYFCLLISLVAGYISFKRAFRRKQYSKFIYKRIKRSFLYSALIGLISSNVITWIVHEDIARLALVERITEGGYSVYFGLLGFFAAAFVLLRLYGLDRVFCINKIARVLLIAHFISRIGCSLKGCCFGTGLDIFGLSFHAPVRELEALLTFILAVIPERILFKKKAALYLFSLSLFRLISDFFRGDDPGVLFGIEVLSPIQLASILVVIVTGVVLFLRPVMRLMKKEQVLDDAIAYIKSSEQKIREKILKKNIPYKPYPANYVPLGKKKRWVKIIISLVLAFAIIISAVIYINPADMSFASSFRNIIDGIIDSVLYPAAEGEELSEENGLTVLGLSDRGKIPTSEAALRAANTLDTWHDFSFTLIEEKTLPSGNILYGFCQTVNGIPVFGKTRAIVTDKDGNALYSAGDSSGFSFTTDTTEVCASSSVTLNEAFGEGVTVLERADCYYDTGDGLISAYHALLTDDGETAVLGAVVQSNNDRIICITAPKLLKFSDTGKKALLTAADEVNALLVSKDTNAIKELSEIKLSRVSDIERNTLTAENALCEVFLKSNLTEEEYSLAVTSAAEISDYANNLNIALFGEILARELHAVLSRDVKISGTAYVKNVKIPGTLTITPDLTIDENTSEAEEQLIEYCREKFGKSVWNEKKNKHDKTVSFTATERASTYRYYVDFADDIDSYKIKGQENQATHITIKTETPLEVEVYNPSGTAIYSTFIEDEYTITMYEEDGHEFLMRIRDSRDNCISVPTGDMYKITLKTEKKQIPGQIKNTLFSLETAYNFSLTPLFYTVYTAGGSSEKIEDVLLLTVLTYLNDSCYSSCYGMEDGIDTAKTVMAETIFRNGGGNNAFQYLKGTELKFTYIHHIEYEGYTALKVKADIMMGDMSVWSDYCFMRLETGVEPMIPIDESTKKLIDLMTLITGDFYSVTALNSDSLYYNFGDAPESVHPTTDITSLYDLWEITETELDGTVIPVKTLDTARALSEGHSSEKVQSFELFTARENLMTVKHIRAEIKIQYETLVAVSTVGQSAKMIFDAATNPVGFIADMTLGENEYTEGVWHVAKYIIDPSGAATDDAFGIVFDAFDSEAEKLAFKLSVFDKVAVSFEEKYKSLGG